MTFGLALKDDLFARWRTGRVWGGFYRPREWYVKRQSPGSTRISLTVKILATGTASSYSVNAAPRAVLAGPQVGQVWEILEGDLGPSWEGCVSHGVCSFLGRLCSRLYCREVSGWSSCWGGERIEGLLEGVDHNPGERWDVVTSENQWGEEWDP